MEFIKKKEYAKIFLDGGFSLPSVNYYQLAKSFFCPNTLSVWVPKRLFGYEHKFTTQSLF